MVFFYTKMRKKPDLFFDLDHTLWDFKANSMSALDRIYKSYPELQSVSQDDFISIYKKHNKKFWKRYRQGYISSDELRWKRFWHSMIDIGVTDVELAQNVSSQYLELLPQQKKLCPGAYELLDELKNQDYRLHIVTNGFGEVQKAKLRSTGIYDYFTTITTSEETKAAKPHPRFFSMALEKANSSLENSVVIGDSLEADIKGALDYGIACIFYNPYDVCNPFSEKCISVKHLSEIPLCLDQKK